MSSSKTLWPRIKAGILDTVTIGGGGYNNPASVGEGTSMRVLNTDGETGNLTHKTVMDHNPLIQSEVHKNETKFAPLPKPPAKPIPEFEDVSHQHVSNVSGNHPCAPWSTTGLVMPHVRGRIGNQMSEYASALGLAKLKGAKPVITTVMRDYLSLFPNLSVKLYKRDLNHECVTSFKKLNPWPPSNEKKIYAADYVYLDSWPFVPHWFHYVKDQLLNEDFVFSQSMVAEVNRMLESVATSIQGNVTADIDKPIYIGIHVRRTDYERFMKKMYKTNLPGASFFLQAAKLLEDVLAKKTSDPKKSKRHLALVVVSDDPHWCKENMMSLPQQLMSTSLRATYSIHFSDEYKRKTRQNSKYFDLAVLSKCNHSIYDYGTFGFWGAYLADGITVLGDAGPRYDIHEKVKMAHFKDWHFLRPEFGNSSS